MTMPDSDFTAMTAHQLARVLLAGPDTENVTVSLEIQDENGFVVARTFGGPLNVSVGTSADGKKILWCAITGRQQR